MMFKLLLCATVATASFDVNDAFPTNTWCGTNSGQITTYDDCQATASRYGRHFSGNGNLDYHTGCIIHHGSVYFIASSSTGVNAANDGYYCLNHFTHRQAEQCTAASTADSAGWITDKQSCEIATMADGRGTYSNSQVQVNVPTAGTDWPAGCLINNGQAYWIPHAGQGGEGSPGINTPSGDHGYLCKNAVATDAVCTEADCTCTAACESDCACNKIVSTTTPGWSAGATTGTSMPGAYEPSSELHSDRQQCAADGLWYACSDSNCNGGRSCASNGGLFSCACDSNHGTAGYTATTTISCATPGTSMTITNANACPTCSDGVQNQDETDVDCGGASCSACSTCAVSCVNYGPHKLVKVTHDTSSSHTHHQCWTVDPSATNLVCECTCCNENDSAGDCSNPINYHH
jgi:hypothetical protein